MGGGSWACSSRSGPRVVKRELPWRAGAEKVMGKLMNLKDAWPFLEPVDPTIAPDYRDIIAHPMDLGTVREKLVSDVYRLVRSRQYFENPMFDVCWLAFSSKRVNMYIYESCHGH